jgi:predicted amidohydrolase
MRVTILQRDIVWGEPITNIERADKAISENAGADLYILPEMFSTGFCTLPEGIAESEGLSLDWLKAKAAAMNAAIAGSVATEEQGKYYNRFYFVKPDGSVEYYDKRHLFTYGGEHNHYTAGDKRVVVEWRGVRILLEVCYDLRFPIWSRNRGDYDMIIYVASWPTPRVEAWKALLVARAIENQCYVAGVNRVGDDPNCTYCGGSSIIDPYGRHMAICADNCECEVSAEIDIEALEAFREKFPVLKDADN